MLSRLATIGIAAVAFFLAILALMGSELIDGMVAYAWTGLGASFGPALVLSLWWRRTTWSGALAGMVGGMIATVVWKNSAALNALLDIKAGPVLISAALVVGFSLASRPADRGSGKETGAAST
jgi:sodium/proline symporter